MRLLVLSDLWPPFPGGAERLMYNLARDLHRRDMDVFVLTGYEAAQQFDGPPLAVLPIGVHDERAEGAAMVLGFVRSSKPDVIIAHHLYASHFGAELVATGIPFVHIVLNGKRVEGAALTVYISAWVRARWGGRSTDLVLTPPAFDDVVADRHGDCIGFIKPIEHKGVELVYDLAALMPERRFLILRGEWQGLEDIRSAPNITFMEPVADIREFYAECRLVLVPSLSEDAGTVAQEATLNGLPCISSDVEGLQETNGGGWRLPPKALQSWYLAIEALDDPKVYADTVASQRAHFDATGQADRLDDFAARIRALVQ